jgi:MscS family membrane protein
MAGEAGMRRGGCVLVLMVAGLLLAWPRPGAPALRPALDTSSPRATWETILAELPRLEAMYGDFAAHPTNATQLAMLRALLRLGSTVFDLSHVPPATRMKHAAAAVGYLADILLRLPPIPLGDIPGPGASPARWAVPGTELELRRITEGPRTGDYIFTDDTLHRLPEFHAAIIDEPVRQPITGITHWREVQRNAVGALLAGLRPAALPAPLRRTVLDSPVWKVLAGLLAMLAVPVLALGWTRLARRWADGAPPWRRRAAWLTVPLVLALLTALAHVFIGWELILGGPLFDAETLLATAVLFLAAAWAAWLLCWLAVELIIATPRIPDESYDAHLLRLIARVAAPVAAGVIVFYGASVVGVPALGLLAGVSVGGIALALAAQSTVENLFGGVSLFADRPFRVGDTIQYGASSGRVEAIGPRSTRIRGLDGTLTAVPNAELAKTHVTNVTARDRFLFQHRLGLHHATSRAQIERLLAELPAELAAVPGVEAGSDTPRVRLVGLGDTSIDIEVFAYVAGVRQAEFLAVQEAMILCILRTVERCGTGFAFGGLAAAPGPEAADRDHPATAARGG